MNATFHRVVASLILVVGVISMLCGQIPDWFATHKDARYPSEQYIIGVGSGTGDNAADAAKKAAQLDLVSQIRVQVQAQVKNVSESYQFNKNEQLYSEFRSTVRTAVSDEITGMEVAETVTDNSTGIVYALVVLQREKYCAAIQTELDAGWKQVNDRRTAGLEFAGQGKLTSAIQNLLEARKGIAPLLPKQTLYDAVSSTPYKPPFNFGPSSISDDIRSILSDVRLTKKSGDEQKGKIGERFSQPFVFQAAIVREGKSVPVIGSMVVFEMPEHTKIGDALTDDQGEASFQTIVRTMAGNGIHARLSIGNADREFSQNLLSSAVNFRWTATGSDVSFSLTVKSKSSKVSSDLSSVFTSAITQLGYKVLHSSKNIIQVTVETGQSNKIEGIAGTMYSVSVNVLATLLDKGTENTLGSATFSAKGLARSESEAIEKAVGNVKIDQNVISDLLEKAMQK